jgi:hypothetical protein
VTDKTRNNENGPAVLYGRGLSALAVEVQIRSFWRGTDDSGSGSGVVIFVPQLVSKAAR